MILSIDYCNTCSQGTKAEVASPLQQFHSFLLNLIHKQTSRCAKSSMEAHRHAERQTNTQAERQTGMQAR